MTQFVRDIGGFAILKKGDVYSVRRHGEIVSTECSLPDAMDFVRHTIEDAREIRAGA
jgi:hypothetical protein